MVKITLGIDGMMCGMCESHVNDAVRNGFPSVTKVSSDRKKKQTVIVSKEEISEQQLKDVIDPTGYTVTSFRSEPYQKKGLFCF